MNYEERPAKWERLWLASFFGFTLIVTAFVVYNFWVFARFQQQLTARVLGNIPNPVVTDWIYTYRVCFLLFPLPWLGFALYALVRGAASVRQLLSYSVTLLFALIALSMLSALAFSLPWFPNPGWRLSWGLDTEKLAQALYAAERNDARANYLLFRHYAYGINRQTDLADYYLARAAELGHTQAQEDLEQRSSVKGAGR